MTKESYLPPLVQEISVGNMYERHEQNIQRSKFIFENNTPVPTSIESLGEKYDIKAKTTECLAKEFFLYDTRKNEHGDITEIEFHNDTAQKYFNGLVSRQIEVWYTDLQKVTDEEFQLAQYNIPGDYSKNIPGVIKKYSDKIRNRSLIKKVEVPAKELYKMYENIFLETLDWLDSLREENIPIHINTSEIETDNGDYEIKRLVIGHSGEKAQDQWLVEEQMTDIMMFMGKYLDLWPKKKILYVYDTTHLDEQKTKRSLATKLTVKLQCAGMLSNHGIFINNYGTNVVKDTSSEKDSDNIETVKVETVKTVRTSISASVVRHETTHGIENITKTTPQSEGLAVMMEHNIDFKAIKDYLRRNIKYSNEVTYKKLTDILSQKPPKGLVSSEICYVPASFFAYVYRELGSRGFKEFLYRLTGYKKTPDGSLGNVEKSLEHAIYITKVKGKYPCYDCKDFIEKYIQEINEKPNPS